MEIIEFKSKILDGKYLSLPRGVSERIGNIEEIKVVLKLDEDTQYGQSDGEVDKERMLSALKEYKMKYPDDNVSLDDFRYVGIVAGNDINDTKDELIKAIEGKYII
uniref:Uncharacterized protein n=1 Tax=Candidatus Desulfatibia profunda TaxID=2841695 RepID=A0A8J6NQA5_9BACT|nr:hypothetical protein [Candidatus Desulfatibia profunda]